MAAPKAHVCIVIAASILYATTVRAHHSFGAEYDAQRPVAVTGVVTKVEWTNPHCHFYVDVPDVEASLAQAEKLGGTRVMGPEKVMEGLVIGLFTDPEGHIIGVAASGT